MIDIGTGARSTWCPGCLNFQLLLGVKNFISKEIAKDGEDKFAVVAGIGCHAKIFDYLNVRGINTLHGRVLPMCLGMKIGNPNLKIIGFSGDGDAYAEGMEHLIHAARYNSDIKYIVQNNQIFALTVGQPTPTSALGTRGKTAPEGSKLMPINPIKIMLASGASFVARVSPDLKEVEKILEEAFKHKGFAFIEVLQPCIIFNDSRKLKEKMYSLEERRHNKGSMEEAMRAAGEFDYNKADRIPMGIFYQGERESFENSFEQLKNLKSAKSSWKEVKR